MEEALRIDEENGTEYWRKAIEKVIKNVMIGFELCNYDKLPVDYEEI